MTSQIQNLSSSVRKISIEMTNDETEKYFVEILKEESKKITIPGFRKGKAPLSLVRKMYGEALFYDNLDKIANNRFWDEIDILGIEIVGTPKITSLDITDDRGLKFDVEFEVIPEIDFSDFEEKLAKMTFIEKDYEITDTYIDEYLRDLQFDNRKEEKTEVVDTFETIVKVERNKESEKGTKNIENISMYLNDKIINPAFRELFMNKKIGDKITTSLNPSVNEEDNNKKKEKRITYEYKIKEIYKVILPELNDDFAKKISNGEVENLEELRKMILEEQREDLEEFKIGELKKQFENFLLENYGGHYPTSLLMETITNYVEMLSENETFRSMGKENLFLMAKTLAEKDLSLEIIRTSLAKKFNLALTEEDIANRAKELANDSGMDYNEAYKFLTNKKNLRILVRVLDNKIFNFFRPKMKIKTQKVVL